MYECSPPLDKSLNNFLEHSPKILTPPSALCDETGDKLLQASVLCTLRA